MKSLVEHNNERRAFYDKRPKLNGIACPECGHELEDTDPNVELCSYPPQKDVRCPHCKWVGRRIA